MSYSTHPLGPREPGPAPLPMIPIDLGVVRGRTLLEFFKRTVDAAPTVRMWLCSFSFSLRTLKVRFPILLLFVSSLHINMGVHGCVKVPGVKVHRWVAGILLQQIPVSHK